MASNIDTMTDDGTTLTPEDVREIATEYREAQEETVGASLFVEVFVPRARAKILDVLLENAGESMTASQIAEAADVSRSSFARQHEALLELGVMERAGQVANAWTYRLNREHPVAQLAGMIDQVLRFGTTSMLLDERFVDTPGEDYEPGDHPADER